MRVVVLGNRESRRVSLFVAAARRLGLTPPCVVDYVDFLDGRDCLSRHVTPGCVLRIESPGENWETGRRLLSLGYEAARLERPDALTPDVIADLAFCRGAIVRPRQWYLGLVALMQRVEKALTALPGVRLMAHPRDIPILFDKTQCQERFAAADLPVPRFWGGLASYEALRAMCEDRHRRLFVKVAHGASALGVMAVEWQGSRVRALTTVEMAESNPRRLFVSKKIRVYEGEAKVAALIDALAPERLHVEEWLPKARFDSRSYDLRVVTIGGRAFHVVGRSSSGPITNLNLGNRRLTAEQVRGSLGRRWPEALEFCERAAAVFPDSYYLGLDLLVRPGGRGFALLEANAFGDLLPGLLHEGRDTYETELNLMLQERRVAS